MPAKQKHPTIRRGHGRSHREIQAPEFEKPPLPTRTTLFKGKTVPHKKPWHPVAVENWNLRCDSVLAEQEFLDVDIPTLTRLLQMETIWLEEIEEKGYGRVTLVVEIRMHEQELCLPLKGRRSLGLVKAQTVEAVSKIRRPKVDAESTAVEIPSVTGEAVDGDLDRLYE